jgi:hypothetical protein
LRPTKKLTAEKRHETHFLSNEEREKWIDDHVKRETAAARKHVEDAKAAVQQEQDDLKYAEIAGFTNKEPQSTGEEILIAIGDSLSDLASSNHGEDGQDEDDEETELGKLSEDAKPGWLMATMTKTVQQRMERFRPKQMKLDELTQLGWEDAADYFCQRDKKYDTSELRVPAVVQPQTNADATAPALRSLGELMESLDIVPGISQMLQGTSGPGSSHFRIRSVQPQSKTSISSLEPATERDMSPLLKAKPVEPVCFYPCI